MFLSNPAKSFLAAFFILFSTTGCGILESNENTAMPRAEEPKNRFPFKTKEPENFQCEIIETAGDTVRRKRLAKKGNWRRIDFDLGEKTERTLLQTDKEYLIDLGRGMYAESITGTGGQFSDLTHELLNISQRAEFEETARDGNLVRYTVRPADNQSSEISIHYDETIGIPVKQEYFSLDGGERSLMFTVEIVNFRTEPNADAFLLPAAFRRVNMDELLRASNQ